jgi:hypothetical protein
VTTLDVVRAATFVAEAKVCWTNFSFCNSNIERLLL